MKKIFILSIALMMVVSISSLISSVYADLNDGLVAYYPFNGNANDESGNSRNGEISGATLIEDRFGNTNSAYRFDGSDYIEIAHKDDFKTENFTVSLWVKAINNRQSQFIFEIGWPTSPDSGHLMYLNYNYQGNTGLTFWGGHETSHSWINFNGLVDNEWINYTYTFDGNTLKMFVNGYKTNEEDIPLVYYNDDDNYHAVMIGTATAFKGNDDYGLHGDVDDVRIYSRALSETEVKQLYYWPITLSIPTSATEDKGTLSDEGIVSILSPANTDLTINLSSDDISEITVPTTVTILADQNSATFDITVIDDSDYDCSKTVIITASATGYGDGSDDITVKDNEISLTIPSSATEGGGVLEDDGVVKICDAADSDLIISLASDDSTEVTVPASVTILEDQNSVTFDITIVDDDDVDGSQTATITASATGYGSDTADITIADDDPNVGDCSIEVSPISGIETQENGATASFTIVLSTQPTTNVTINLTSSAEEEGTAWPASLTFTSNNWNTPQTVTVTGIDDNSDDGNIIYTIHTSPAISNDSCYNGVNASDVQLTNIDDDGKDDKKGCFMNTI